MLLAASALGPIGDVYASDSATVQCDGQTPARWYSPPTANLADKAAVQCAACDDPVNASHASCEVYGVLQSEACRDGRCSNEQGEFVVNWQQGYALQQSLRYQRPLKFILDAGSNCWFLVWALDPVIGVEHVGARDSVNFWRAGYEAATQHMQPAIPESELAMIIQPANKRSQHQLHIHIGRLQAGYRLELDQLTPDANTVHERSFDGHDFWVRFLPDMPGKAPLDGYRVFDEVASMVPGGESAMPLFGILVARASNGRGSWVMAAQGLTRRELVLAQPKTCQLKHATIRRYGKH